jgi:CHAT domain-containing protein
LSGVPQHIATLWSAEVDALRMFIANFYSKIHAPGVTFNYARAYRETLADVSVDLRFSNPRSWAMFLFRM